MKEKLPTRRILAILGIVLLIGLYLTSLVLSLIHSPQALNFLKISLAATVIIPIILYFILMFMKIAKPKPEAEEKVFADEKDDPFSDEDFNN